jgi:hypothetical protein
MTIDDPDVIAELSDLYPLYENALVSNDVEKLIEMFWADPYVMRFGVAENLYGHKEIDEFRKGRPAVSLAREVLRLDIVSFGKDFASITLEFKRGAQHGRQSQTLGSIPAGLAHRVGACFPYAGINNIYIHRAGDRETRTIISH